MARLLQKAQVGYVGVADSDGPYVVPQNFVWFEEQVYFHGPCEGRLAGVLTTGAKATFTVAESYGTIADPVPGHTSTDYLSVMVFGMASSVTDMKKATAIMQAMLDKYVPGYYDTPLAQGHVASYVSSLGSKTAIFELTSDRITAKRSHDGPDVLFYPGRTRKQDVTKNS